ncbi:MFS general substrate transporter [Penicillium chermesinum]|uniref:MFS general substrate transporter n=1 Tax=Penicillium chermesinum TaxID=63820 RepID=A0A9W9NV33_9EURO|nr:MFS general substrate transporter [Penicillium chermesinum]KAJ5226361.1 MFS general substrate transporter [Penicillium chermesinum]
MNPTQQSAPDTPAGEKETSDPTPGSHAKDEEQPTVPRSGTPKHVEFSVFTVNQRRAMVTVGSLAAFFSPLSSSIYFPALDTIATALSVSTSKIDITVTTYLILQGIAPMFIAGFSDGAGRRPAYMICFTVYLAANLGLGLQNSYAALAVLRCLQSAGSSGTVALANGLVGDLVTSADRGSYIAFASLGSMLGPSLSPIIGGLLSQYLNWHWLFWFLLIFGGIFFLALLLFLPETCRKVVGDGSVPPPVLNTSVTDLIRQRRRSHKGLTPDPEKVAEVRKNYRLRFPSPLPTLKVILDIETSIILLTTALMFACFYAVMTGATSSFHEVYHFNNIQTGLMYVPIGAGGVASAFTTGRLLDWNYRRHAKRAGLPVIRNVRQDLSNFNIERARLEIGLPMYYLSVSTVIAYGWVLGIKVNLAAPVILLFLCGWSLNATAQVLSALMVDLWPGRSAAATAANNFFRCELGAASSAAITPMKNAMGWGWAYTTLALIAVVVSPTFWYLMSHGIKLRQKRLAKEKARSESH